VVQHRCRHGAEGTDVRPMGVQRQRDRWPWLWPCIQLWPTDGKWPQHIELDSFESPFDGKRLRGLATIHYAPNNLQKSTEYDADFNQPHIWVVEWRPNAYVIYFDSKQIVNVTDKTLIPTTPHHFVAQTDMGSWADVPTSKEPTRIELALDYVKQWSYLGS